MSARGQIEKNQYSTIFVLFGLCLALFLFYSIGALRPFQNFSDFLFSPIKKILSSQVISVREYMSIAVSYPQIKENVLGYRLLQKKILELEQKTGELSAENKKLREVLEAPIPSNWKLLPVSVLGVTRTMIVDSGSRDGIEKDMTVVDSAYYVGRVRTVAETSAAVLLPFDADSTILAVTSRGTHGVVKGAFGETMELQRVLQSDALFLGDEVLTTGEDGIGRGLLIGKIKSIQAKVTDPYKTAVLAPLVDIHVLSTVFVVTDK